MPRLRAVCRNAMPANHVARAPDSVLPRGAGTHGFKQIIQRAACIKANRLAAGQVPAPQAWKSGCPCNRRSETTRVVAARCAAGRGCASGHFGVGQAVAPVRPATGRPATGEKDNGLHMQIVIRAIDALNESSAASSPSSLSSLRGIIIYDVVMRYAFNEPTRWAFDVSKQLYGFYFVMLGGYALRHKAHVRVDLVTETAQPGLAAPHRSAGLRHLLFPVHLRLCRPVLGLRHDVLESGRR